jgi:hypothetical protein
MVDVETRRYGVEDKVARLARQLDPPVVTSFMGRGLLSAHPDLVRGRSAKCRTPMILASLLPMQLYSTPITVNAVHIGRRVAAKLPAILRRMARAG